MDFEDAQRRLEAAGWFTSTDGEGLVVMDQLQPTGTKRLTIMGQLAVLSQMARDGRLPDEGAAIMYALVAHLRYLADYYERDLIRALRWDKDDKVVRTWAQVAGVVQAQLGSRQAAHSRWGRLTSPTRRTTSGDSRRGHARPRA